MASRPPVTATMDANGSITAVIVDNAGSGYSAAPVVTIHNGTVADPIAGATLAAATSTLLVQSVVVNHLWLPATPSLPDVVISDTAPAPEAARWPRPTFTPDWGGHGHQPRYLVAPAT